MSATTAASQSGHPSAASPLRVVHTVCSHDCPDSCAVRVTVDATGRATRVAGDPDHPITQGFLCGKVAKYLDRVYSPDRVLTPLRRRADAPKGPRRIGHATDQKYSDDFAAFEPVTWDEALDSIAARLGSIAAAHGPESILPYSYAGTMGLLGYASMDRRFFHRLGASQLDRTICAEAGGQAWNLVYGRKLGTANPDFAHAKLILAWGANIHGNNIHLWPFVEQARRRGARLIVIDPYRTRTAALADWHIAIRPGTDVALALGMIHVILRDGLEDRAYIAEMTHGFDALAVRAREYTPERVAAWTGLSPAEIEQLAREYATTRPAAIRLNYGVQRAENGGTAVRAIAMLPALTGSWRQRGGGAQLSLSGGFQWNRAALERPDLMLASPLGRPARVVNMSRLGHALTELGAQPETAAAEGPCVHALFVYNSNPAAVAPNQNAVRRGLLRPDLFTVVHEQFLTDTTDYADFVLPATTFLEHEEIQGAYGHTFVQHSAQAIAPLGEARPNIWLFRELAARMGFREPCFQDDAEAMMQQALNPDERGLSRNPGMAAISLEGLRQAGHLPLTLSEDPANPDALPFAAGPLETPSGKIELYSEVLAHSGAASNGAGSIPDPLPAFTPPTESRHSPAAARFPLELLPRKADHFMNSTFANLDGHRRMQSQTAQALEIHPDDATPRGIADGDRLRVWNDRGSVTLRARLTRGIAPGVVAAQLDWSKASPDGSGINQLTSERLTDIGQAATFYSTLVQVARAD